MDMTQLGPINPVFRAPDGNRTEPRLGDDAGDLPGPRTREHSLTGRDGEPIRVLGRLLAYGTSWRAEHSHPVDVNPDSPTTHAQPRERCSACRWFEVSILGVDADLLPDGECTCAGGTPEASYAHESHCGTEPPSGRYLVVTAGRTEVPGEVNFHRAEFTDSPFAVVELLVQTRESATGARRFIPQTSALALAEAAGFDDGIRDAYLAHSRAATSGDRRVA